MSDSGPADAVVLVDVQNDFLDPEGSYVKSGLTPVAPDERGSMIGAGAELVDSARRSGVPVVYVKTILRKDLADSSLPRKFEARLQGRGSPVKGSWGAQIVKEVAPAEGDVVITKKGQSAFQFTNLDSVLRRRGVECCLVVGGGLPGSISATCRQGAALGYDMGVAVGALHPGEKGYLPTLRSRTVVRETGAWVESMGRRAAAERRDAAPGRTALLLIDIQNDAVHPQGVYEKLGYARLSEGERSKLLENNAKLLERARASGMPVVFALNSKRADSLDNAAAIQALRIRPARKYVEGTWGAEIVSELRPRDGEIVVRKNGHSAFGFTPLHRTMRNLGVTRCIVTGGGVVGCLADSVVEGAGLGYDFFIVSDATFRPVGARALDFLKEWGEVVPTSTALGLIDEAARDHPSMSPRAVTTAEASGPGPHEAGP